MRIKLSLIALMGLFGFTVFAQSNERVDALLGQLQSRADDACYLVLSAGGQISEDTEPETAYETAMQNHWLPTTKQADEPILLNEFCALVMYALDLKGGLMFRLFPGPRYAYKHFVALGIVNSNGGPKRTVPGDEVLMVVSQAMELREKNQ